MSRAAAVAAVLLCQAGIALAQDPDTPNVRFNGYGTLGVVHSSEDQAEFTSSLFVPRGAGHRRSLSPEVDSRIGLQATAELTPRLTAVGQVVVEQNFHGSYRPTVEWANLRFDITQELSVRAGRMVQPTFMASEYRKVGYATPWVRPPGEFYRHLPVTNFDGIAVDYTSRVGTWNNTLRGKWGRRDMRSAGVSTVEVRDAGVVTNTLEAGAVTLFAAYSTWRLTIEDLEPLVDAFAQFGPEGVAIAQRYNGKRIHMANVGAHYDPGDWFVTGEWLDNRSRTILGDNRAWYVTGGYRYGAVTPYATFASTRVRSERSTAGLSSAGLPPPMVGAVEGLNAALNRALGMAAVQSSVSVGARWDFARMAALKVQFDRLNIGEGSPGVLINEQPGFRRGGNASLFSISVDFVF